MKNLFQKLDKLSEDFFVLRNSLDDSAVTASQRENMLDRFQTKLDDLIAEVNED